MTSNQNVHPQVIEGAVNGNRIGIIEYGWMGIVPPRETEKVSEKESTLVDIGQTDRVRTSMNGIGVTDPHHDSLSTPPPQLINTPSHVTAENQ